MYNAPIKNTLYNGGGAILMSALDQDDNPIGGFFNVGTCDAASIAYNITSIEQKDSSRGTLSTVKKIVTEKSGELTIAAKSFSADNMGLALFGTVAEDAAEVGVQMTDNAYLGRFVYLDGMVSEVTAVLDSTNATLAEGTDYKVNGGTIYITETANINDGEEITITYNRAQARRVEAMVEGSKEVAIVFEGTNCAADNRALKVTIFKCSLSPSEQRDLISADDFATLTIKGTILESTAVNGVGESRMVKEEYQV